MALIYVEDGSNAVRARVSDELRAAGFEVSSPEAKGDHDAETRVVCRFRCALLDLGRSNGAADAVDSAQLLRLYQPALPVAFLFDDKSAHLLERARCLGPVFHEPDGLDAALAWAIEQGTKG